MASVRPGCGGTEAAALWLRDASKRRAIMRNPSDARPARGRWGTTLPRVPRHLSVSHACLTLCYPGSIKEPHGIRSSAGCGDHYGGRETGSSSLPRGAGFLARLALPRTCNFKVPDPAPARRGALGTRISVMQRSASTELRLVYEVGPTQNPRDQNP